MAVRTWAGTVNDDTRNPGNWFPRDVPQPSDITDTIHRSTTDITGTPSFAARSGRQRHEWPRREPPGAEDGAAAQKKFQASWGPKSPMQIWQSACKHGGITMRRSVAALSALALACFVASATTRAQNVYITNQVAGTVSVIDTATNTVTATIPVGSLPQPRQAFGVAVTPAGNKVYVTFLDSNIVRVIDTATNTVTTTATSLGLNGRLTGVAVTPDGSKVYVASDASNIVRVIDTATNTVTARIPIGPPCALPSCGSPAFGAAVTPDGKKIYVTANGTVVVIDTTTNAVTATITVSGINTGVAVTPDGSKVYVATTDNGTVSVIDTATNRLTATIPVGGRLFGLAVTPNREKVYVTGNLGSTVSVISTMTDTVTGTTSGFNNPQGVAVTPDGKKVYVANLGDNNVLVIDAATNAVSTITDPSFSAPTAFGQFIQPATAKKFAGTPGQPNCPGVSASALARQYGSIPAAAEALGYPDVMTLTTAFTNYCTGV
jgi:YVTN family beta-propeller protein